MNATDITFPFSTGVRRAALAAGFVSALATGGIPFVGFGPALVMGRAMPIPSPLALALHLAVATLYGAIFSLVIRRSRDWKTVLATCLATLALYLANGALIREWDFPKLVPESSALLAHLVFGFAFTAFFKLAEIGAVESGERGTAP